MRRFLVALALLAACSPAVIAPTLAPSRLPFRADSVRSTTIAPGLAHHYVYSAEGPWAVHLLELRRDSCWSLRAVKGADIASGRIATLASLRALAASTPIYAGVNADFFSLATGVPTGAHIEEGRVLAGPGVRPVIAFDSAGAVRIGGLSARGAVMGPHGAAWPLSGWNRPVIDGLAVLDRAWGPFSDSGRGRIKVGVSGSAPHRVLFVDTLAAASEVPADGYLLIAGPAYARDSREALAALRTGDTVSIARSMLPSLPRNAVGGWPIILRNGVITTAADSAGATFAPVRHPRTAIGVADGGRTVLIAVVDGRQKPYSDGMTLRELARLFHALGATDALNLDGGGSTTLVTADSGPTRTLRIRNRPSDAAGDRTVGNSLALARHCGP